MIKIYIEKVDGFIFKGYVDVINLPVSILNKLGNKVDHLLFLDIEGSFSIRTFLQSNGTIGYGTKDIEVTIWHNTRYVDLHPNEYNSLELSEYLETHGDVGMWVSDHYSAVESV